MNKHILPILFMCLCSVCTQAQKATLSGQVHCSGNLSTVVVNNGAYQTYTDKDGNYRLKGLPTGKVRVTVFCHNFQQVHDSIDLTAGLNEYDFDLQPLNEELESITISEKKDAHFSTQRMRAIEGTSIYAGKKNELILMDEINGNTANNDSRAIFGKIPGLNIWESDAAGIQLDIGARGLNPKRSASFNVRQNGYGISADPLGYPESYYTPASDALKSIQIVRGAASLQYGSQFGGMINFQMKNPSEYKFNFKTKNTYGSYNQFTTYNEVSGSHKQWSYFAYYQYKRGDGWRPNSGYQQHQGFLNLNYNITENMIAQLEYTVMKYNAQQPGGLTDQQFDNDPTQSNRERNWFQVNWNLLALKWNWKINANMTWSARAFGLLADRKALGYLGRIDRPDPMEERNLIAGSFKNAGAESRFLWRYKIGDNAAAGWLLGARYYRGKTRSRQGLANDGSNANFSFQPKSGRPLSSDFDFPSENIALFTEHAFFITPKWTVVPGARFEYINTKSKGQYLNEVTHPLTDEILLRENKMSSDGSERSFVLFGLGTTYKIIDKKLEIYGNFSQNYRAINFNDIRINNPNYNVDPNMQDEAGFNADLGFRGQIDQVLTYDISGFYLRYNDRIGTLLKKDTSTFQTYRYRTNISDAQNYGLEAFAELDWWSLFSKKSTDFRLSTFVNLSLIRARYINSDNSAVSGNQVELVPPYTIRTGLKFGYKNFQFSYRFNYVAGHFTDATNAEATSSAIYGKIPSYYVMDLSASYEFKKWFTLSGGINNLTNNYYFTRRATGYPGPGIIPSRGIAGYISVSFSIHAKK